MPTKNDLNSMHGGPQLLEGAAPCPCQSGESHAACCDPYLAGSRQAPTAEALMRSRYTAYALQRVDYLLRTHAATTRASVDRQDIATWAAETRFVGLEVLLTKAGGDEDQRGEVTFVARMRGAEGASVMCERSRFERHGDRWFYVDGDQLS